MKKKLLLLFLVGTLQLSACGSDNATDQSETTNTKTNVENGTDKSPETEPSVENVDVIGDIDVDKGIFDVVLTIPSDFVGEKTQEDLDNLANELGFKSIVLHEDGSATYTMTKKQHKQILSEYKDQIDTSLNEMIGSDDYPNFIKIEPNDNYTEFTVTTKSTELDLAESFSVLSFYLYGGLYSSFSGEKIDNISVTFVNADSGEIIETANSSDME